MMRQITTEIEIQASAERVWAILTDLAGYSAWNPLIREARGTLTVPGRLELHIAAEGLAARRVEVELLAVEPNRELRWLGRLGLPRLLDGDHQFVITPLGTGRVQVVQQESFSGLLVPLVARWLIPNMAKAFKRMNDALKQRSEQTSSPGA
jgi:hypothetical protein